LTVNGRTVSMCLRVRDLQLRVLEALLSSCG
jgi:hypothetical protein